MWNLNYNDTQRTVYVPQKLVGNFLPGALLYWMYYMVIMFFILTGIVCTNKVADIVPIHMTFGQQQPSLSPLQSTHKHPNPPKEVNNSGTLGVVFAVCVIDLDQPGCTCLCFRSNHPARCEGPDVMCKSVQWWVCLHPSSADLINPLSVNCNRFTLRDANVVPTQYTPTESSLVWRK